MSANFTSGWLGNNEAAWHNEGVVTEGSLPAQEAFETADALFTVAKHPLFFKDGLGQEHESNAVSLVRQDNGTELGIVTDQYEVVQNTRLLEMAQALREEVDMDSVVVLADGGKVCFTARIRGTSQEVTPGDRIVKNLVGYLGHDGKTGIGALFTDVRVVCTNTLALAMAEATSAKRLTHKGGANADVSRLIQSISVARQGFDAEVDDYRLMADTKLTNDLWVHYLETLYSKELQGTVQKDRSAPARPKTLDDLRVTKHLNTALNYGFGTTLPGVHGSMWGAVNAVTEVLTSTKRGDAQRKMQSTLFGTTKQKVQDARRIALELCA